MVIVYGSDVHSTAAYLVANREEVSVGAPADVDVFAWGADQVQSIAG